MAKMSRKALRKLIYEMAYEDKLDRTPLVQHGGKTDPKYATFDALRHLGMEDQIDDDMENYDTYYHEVFRSLRDKGVTEDEIKAVVDYMMQQFDIPSIP